MTFGNCRWCLRIIISLAFGMAVIAGAMAVAAEKAAKSGATAKPKETVGNPLASWLIEQMVNEINAGLKDRGIADRFATFQAYAGQELDSTAGKAMTSEVTGNCRFETGTTI